MSAPRKVRSADVTPADDQASRCAGCGKLVTGPRDAQAMNERWCQRCGGSNPAKA